MFLLRELHVVPSSPPFFLLFFFVGVKGELRVTICLEDLIHNVTWE